MIHIYLFIFLLLLIFIIVFAFIFRKKEFNESFITNRLTDQNLLQNSSFENGKNIREFQEKSGNADIIVYPNPGVSEYVLRQSKNDKIDYRTSIFYQIKVNVKPDKIYSIKCLYYSTNNLPLIHRLQYKNMNDEVIYLKTLSDCKKNKNFENQYCLFKTPKDDNDTIELLISLMYNLNNIKGYNYLTDIVVEEVIDGFNLPVTANLRCYLNVFHPKSVESSNSIIKDLSGNNFDFTASRNLGVQKMNVDLMNNVLTGPNSFVMQNKDRLKYYNKFTIFLYVKGMGSPMITESFTDSIGVSKKIDIINEEDYITIKQTIGLTVLKIAGNQYTALELVLPDKYGHIYLIAAGEIYRTEIQVVASLESLFTITYDGDKIYLYLNGELVLKTLCPKIYFNNPPVTINPSAKFLGSFYVFAYYNDSMSQEDIVKMTKYFTKMNACGSDLANPLLDSNLDDFIKSEETETKTKTKTETETDIENENDKEFDQTCPKVIYENEHYYVIIPYNSKLAKNIGYSGIRDYGTDIDNARKIFEINFPKCRLPNLLDKSKYKAKLDDCPFIMLKPENPCNQYECKNTDWKKGIPDNNNCKRSIDVYCSKYSDIDPACYCWKKENKDKKECLKWRGNFEAEDKCDFRKFNIEKHPDSKDYIKKNQIPCWGCNLDAPESTGEYSNRKGSGAR